MNVKMGMMDATTNVTTHREASTVRATPPLTWILMEGPASLVCSVLSSPYASQLTFIELNHFSFLLSGSLTTTYVIDPTVSTTGMGIRPEETPPGDMATSIANGGPIHSRTIMASDTLLFVLSSHLQRCCQAS